MRIVFICAVKPSNTSSGDGRYACRRSCVHGGCLMSRCMSPCLGYKRASGLWPSPSSRAPCRCRPRAASQMGASALCRLNYIAMRLSVPLHPASTLDDAMSQAPRRGGWLEPDPAAACRLEPFSLVRASCRPVCRLRACALSLSCADVVMVGDAGGAAFPGLPSPCPGKEKGTSLGAPGRFWWNPWPTGP